MQPATFVLAAAALGPVLAMPSWHTQSPSGASLTLDRMVHWSPPGTYDVRGPCPGLNSLANHGFLPHSGRNLSQDIIINALNSSFNFDEELSTFLFQEAITTSATANATSFNLDDLSRHGILEHDASLSRGDYYFGDDHTFNQTVFDQTKSYWTTPLIDVQQAAAARLARVTTSNATNPTFALSELGEEFGFGETAAYILVFGDRSAGTAPRAWVEYLFENERLPTELGWSRPNQTITSMTLETMLERVVNATGGSTDVLASLIKRGGLHAGMKA